MLKEALKSPTIQELIEGVKNTPSILIEHLWDTPKAILTILLQQATQKNILILSGKKDDRFLDAFSFFNKEILDFLPWETLPGEEIPPSIDISGKRIEILHKLTTTKTPCIVHCPIQSLMQKILSPKSLTSFCSLLQVGKTTSFSALPELLINLGYRRCPIAADKGEFAIRGGLIDIFPIASKNPYRIDFFGDVIESIRIYDPIGQTSIKKVDSMFLCPASEWSFLKKEKKAASLLEYLGPNTIIIFDDLLAIEDSYVALKSLIHSQDKLLFTLENLLEQLPNFHHLFFLKHQVEELSNVVLEGKTGRKFHTRKHPFQPLSFHFFDSTKPLSSCRWSHPFKEISDFFSRFENTAASTMEEILHGIGAHTKNPLTIHFTVSGPPEETMIKEKFSQLKIPLPKNTSFDLGYLARGFVLEDINLACIPAAELTHRYKVRREGWRNSYHTPSSEFHQISPGDVVVHIHSGIGKFLGIAQKQNHLGEDTEYLQIEYAENSQLYVPVSESHLINRYIGSREEKPAFSTLGSKKWHKICLDAQSSIEGYAKELLQKTAERVASPGFCYPEDSTDMQLFEEEFPFFETEDQLKAIAAIKKDMCSQKAMDRLICGDVGYGKTEVAMRAAFKAVIDGGKQVAVLVPTTVLAMQHYETFIARMANFPIEIAIISRFSSAKKAKETMQKLKEGSIDILIGTHRLISKDINFKDLGLLIIDEEQRFGVRAKEHIKGLKSGVDCLTLSATPIPRTLYMSLIGARDLSEINTPPQDRLPIKSILTEKDNTLIQTGLLREFSRDGQAIFIHNRVETIHRVAEEIQKLVPEAKIVVGHGQMSADEIDTVFHCFKTGEADLLVATTIIENGIDIPNANTIFIDRADLFGMADLYQLRGRVGRWNKPAYAYFLTPKNQTLPELSRQRLQSLAESSGHGAGMKIALRDLEMRGAGDILGVQQSGQISAIGFHFYCKLLKKAVEALKKKKPVQFIETRMDFAFDARLPSDYINESSLRMELYYRLGNASSSQEVDEISRELTDRFGPAPKQVSLLILFSRIRVLASSLQILKLKFDKFTFQAEKQILKTVAKETFPLPPLKDLAIFEQKVTESLKNWTPRVSG